MHHAVAMRVPVPKDVALKSAKDWELIGTKIPRLDSVQKTTGTGVFALDVRRPGMLTAVVKHPEVFGGKVGSFDATETKKVEGVVDVIEVPSGVAVLATDTWAAIEGRRLLKVTWDRSKAEIRSTAEIIAEYRKMVDEQGISAEKRGELKFSYSYGGKLVNASTDLPLAQVPLQIREAQKSSVAVTNSSKGSLFVRLVLAGTPARGEEKAEENNLTISVNYADMKNNPINPTKLEQGTQFAATVTVKNPGLGTGYENLALTQIFPSGWEINNLRLTGDENTVKSDHGNYQDIRDDRVYTYFNLNNGEVRTFKIVLTASYAGNYYLPAITCEAMYDHSIYVRTSGQVVDVVKGGGTP